jgi:hypothetical protein
MEITIKIQRKYKSWDYGSCWMTWLAGLAGALTQLKNIFMHVIL